mmetsp:Transcript_119303/g.289649  ORF Transcript_119303/g.289649 Transcript_119303/m.289649 type:complete len:135 (+) Transcript_119303:3-407(+)
MFNYAKWKSAADVAFAAFAVVWIPTRHGLFFIIYFSLINEAPVLLKDYGWEPEREIYWGDTFYWTYVIALGAFQCLMLFWLNLLLRAVYKALTTGLEDLQDEDPTEDASKSKGNANANKDKGKGKGKGKSGKQA